MRLFIIRHCQSENNALWQRNGTSDGRLADPPLTDIGYRQAEQLAEFIAGLDNHDSAAAEDPQDRHGIDLTHLYCSLMNRSLVTGQYIARAVGLTLVAREDIHERGGIYLRDPVTKRRNGLAGPNRDHFSKFFPSVALPDALGSEGWWNRPYEDRETALVRAQSFLEWLLMTHDGTDDNVAIVTHGGFMQSLFNVLLEIPQLHSNLGRSRDIWLKFNNGSITRVDFFDDVVRVGYQNRVEFFPDELLT